MSTKAPAWNTRFQGFCATARRGFFHLGDELVLSKKTIVTLAAVLGLAAAGAFAAPARASFEKVPLEAKRALGATVGKPIIKGVVFLNGHLVDFGASCQVVRSGTAIYLRQKKGEKKVDLQVTPPLKPWNAFLETQDSSVVAAVEEEAPAPAVEAPKPKAEPKPEPVVKKPAPKPKSEEEDADDFFDDDGEDESDAAKPEPESKVADAEEVVEEEPAKPEAAEEKPAAKPSKTLKLTGAFAKNAAVDRLLKPINETRQRIDAGIRNGRVYFFSARYGMRSLEPRLGVELLKVLPGQMKDAANGADLYRRLRARNILFVSEETCGELMANRVDYLKLDQLRLRQKAEAETNRLIYGN